MTKVFGLKPLFRPASRAKWTPTSEISKPVTSHPWVARKREFTPLSLGENLVPDFSRLSLLLRLDQTRQAQRDEDDDGVAQRVSSPSYSTILPIAHASIRLNRLDAAARLAETGVREYISFGGLETGQQISTGRAAAGRTHHAPL